MIHHFRSTLCCSVICCQVIAMIHMYVWGLKLEKPAQTSATNVISSVERQSNALQNSTDSFSELTLLFLQIDGKFLCNYEWSHTAQNVTIVWKFYYRSYLRCLRLLIVAVQRCSSLAVICLVVWTCHSNSDQLIDQSINIICQSKVIFCCYEQKCFHVEYMVLWL